MFTWLTVNLALGAIALAFIALNTSAPSRLRFHAAFAGMLCWLVRILFMFVSWPKMLS